MRAVGGRAGGATRRVDPVGVAFVLLTSLQFGAVVVLGKVATRVRGLPVPSLLAWRFGVAALLLGAALLASRQPLAAAPGERWSLVGLGVAGYAVEAAFFFEALRHATASAVTLLFFTYPVAVAVISFLAGRGLPGWLLGGALACSVAGSAVVAVSGGAVGITPTGVGLALGSSCTFALYLVGVDAAVRRTNSLVGAMWVSGSASAGLALYAVATGSGGIPHGMQAWGPVLGLGGFTAGAFVCLFAGLRRLGAVRTSVLSATEPLTATALAALFLGERLTPAVGVGGVLILAGVVGASLARARGPAEPPVP